MPFQELLGEAIAEHEALQAKYDEALVEIDILRARFADVQISDIANKDFAGDTEATPAHQYLALDPIHSAVPPEVDCTSRPRSKTSPPEAEQRRALASVFSARASITKARRNFMTVGGTFGRRSKHEGRSQKRQLQEMLRNFLQNPVVETVLVCIVLSNVAVMWVETDRTAARKPRTNWGRVAAWVYLALYACEFALRFFADRGGVLKDKLSRLDLIVIIVDLISIVYEEIFGDRVLGGFNASMFRLLRGFKLVRVLKILRFVKELQLLIHGLFGAMKAVFFATVMLEAVVILWSFIFVELVHPRIEELDMSGKFDQCPQCPLKHSSMWHSHSTIWQQVIANDSWGLVTLDVLEAYPETSLIFMGCLMSIQFAMLNLIFTVIVDAAILSREEDAEHKLGSKKKLFETMKKKFIGIYQSLDTNADGELSVEELIEGCKNNKDFSDIIAELDISFEDISSLFMIMDEDRSGTVSYVEFVNNIYTFRQHSLHTMMMFLKGYVVDLRCKVKEYVLVLLRQNLQQSQQNAEVISSLEKHVHNLVDGREVAGGWQQNVAGTTSLPCVGQAVSASDTNSFETPSTCGVPKWGCSDGQVDTTARLLVTEPQSIGRSEVISPCSLITHSFTDRPVLPPSTPVPNFL